MKPFGGATVKPWSVPRGGLFLSLLLTALSTHANLNSASASFSPPTIEAGSASRLTITVSNQSPGNPTNISLSVTYPSGLTNASSPNPVVVCSDGTGTVTAAANSNTLTWMGGKINGNKTCTVSVAVTAPAGTYTLPAITLTSTAGSASTAAANLTVTAFSCAAPPSAPAGLTCYCDDFNRASLNPSPIFNSNWLVTSSDDTGLLPRIVTPGRLQLTANSRNNAKAATVPGLFPGQNNYMSVEFLHYAYPNTNGADGMVVVLSDASVPPVPGGFGGSLGYAQRSGINGFAGGWIGVGIDEFGNYQNSGEGRQGGPGARKDSVAIRGSGSGTSNYRWLAGTAADLSPGIDAATSPSPAYRYQIVVDARTATKAVQINRDTGSGYQSLINLPDIDAAAASQGTTQASVPDNWLISITGSTGGSTNFHEIGQLRICAAKFLPPDGGSASGFNAVDEAYGMTTTVPGRFVYLTGRIFTKLVGAPFRLNVAAIANNDLMTTYVVGLGSKSVSIKLVDNSDDGCQINNNQPNYCSATCKAKAAVPGGSQTLSLVAGDKGLKQSADFTLSRAYKKLAVIVSDGATSACATDAFSVRPRSLTVTATTTGGTALASHGAGASGTPVVKAGSSFSMVADSATADYDGTPSIDTTKIRDFLSSSSASGLLSGTFSAATASNGRATGTGFAYNEVGYVLLDTDAVQDSTFTAIDAGDCVSGNSSNSKDSSGKYGCKIGSAATSWGRFVPDRFVLSAANVGTCNGFNYMGQAFPVTFTLSAANSAGGVTANYTTANGYAKLDPGNVTLWPPGTHGSQGLAIGARSAASNLSSRLAIVGTPTGNWTAGVSNISANLTFSRPSTSTADVTWGPYEMLDIGIAPQDGDGTTLQASTLNLDANFDGIAERKVLAQSKARFGRLRLLNRYGSVSPLLMPVEAQYWGGQSWVKNTDDSCTTTLGGTPQVTFVANPDSGWTLKPNAFDGGEMSLGGLKIEKASSGETNITATVPDWLKWTWGGVANSNPSAKATVGIFGTKESRKAVHIRETY